MPRWKYLIWHVTCWVIWLQKNGAIFKNSVVADLNSAVFFHVERLWWI
ncbi:hypothetical protein GLYMA_06G261250v4 [Glycine max]|nr:hypothetical protein GLYMA_06G261250v4 [Glycine max]KAH1127716.1 hypothetical protein GYH30_016326 [Glycine max]